MSLSRTAMHAQSCIPHGMRRKDLHATRPRCCTRPAHPGLLCKPCGLILNGMPHLIHTPITQPHKISTKPHRSNRLPIRTTCHTRTHPVGVGQTKTYSLSIQTCYQSIWPYTPIQPRLLFGWTKVTKPTRIKSLFLKQDKYDI